MIHSQYFIKFRPKYSYLDQWYMDYTELSNYVNVQAADTIAKQTDSSQISLSDKAILNANVSSITYANGRYTFHFANDLFKVNEFRWFTLKDNDTRNKYKIESNTKNSVTILPNTECHLPGIPSGTPNIDIRLPMFEIGDEIDMYAFKIIDGNYRDVTENDLVWVGQIKAISNKLGTNGLQTILTLEKIDEVIFKSMSNPKLSYDSTYKTCMDKIRYYIIEWINQQNKNMLQIVWDSNNPEKKRDNVTPFPDVSYFSDYKSNNEIIDELLTAKYTEDGEYYYYIRPAYSAGKPVYLFSIRPRDTIAIHNLVENVDFRLISRDIDKGEIVSFMIIRCGKDMYDNNITTYYMGDMKNGMAGKPMAYNFAGDIMKFEQTKNPASFDDDTPVFMPKELKNGTGSYTTAYSVPAKEAEIFPTKLTAGKLTTSNAKDYQKWVRWLAKAKGRLAAQDFILHNNFYKNKIQIDYYNVPTNMIPGTVDSLTIDSIGWTPPIYGGYNYTKKLRAETREINLTENGLTVSVQYEEDWELKNDSEHE